MMKTLVLLMFASFLSAPASPAAKKESPFACDRIALSPEVRKRHFEELGPALRALRTGVRELPNGYEFRFPSDAKTIVMMMEWVEQERLCCPFFDIDVRLEREGGPVWLRLTGRPGTKDSFARTAPTGFANEHANHLESHATRKP